MLQQKRLKQKFVKPKQYKLRQKMSQRTEFSRRFGWVIKKKNEILPQKFAVRLDQWVTFQNPWPKTRHGQCQCLVHWPNFLSVMRCQDPARQWWLHLPPLDGAVVGVTAGKKLELITTFVWSMRRQHDCPESPKHSWRAPQKAPKVYRLDSVRPLLLFNFATLQIFTSWKLRGLGITGSLQGKPGLSMEKDS